MNTENPIAFPCNKQVDTEPGMTLRDYFAAKVINGFCASREQWLMMMKDRGKMNPIEYVVSESFLIADEMLKQRTKTK